MTTEADVSLTVELADGVPVTLAVGSNPLPKRAADGSPPRGRGVLVVQEAFGVTAHIESICRRLAAVGFVAAAPHLHHRAGQPAPVADDFGQARPLMDSWTAEGIATDLKAGMAVLSDAGCGEFGIIGFCAGGSIALWAASTLPVAAAVSFYGGGLTSSRWEGVPTGLESAAAVKAPWLGIYGDLDASIPVEEVEQLTSALGQVAVPTDVLRYPEAGHAFNNDTRPDHYHQGSATDAWAHAIAWLDAHLHSPAPPTSFVS